MEKALNACKNKFKFLFSNLSLLFCREKNAEINYFVISPGKLYNLLIFISMKIKQNTDGALNQMHIVWICEKRRGVVI